MQTAILILHILVGILVILVVMIQGGENVDITAAFGGVSQAAFGPRGTVSTLAKSTWVLAAIFMATSITLTVWATKTTSGSVLENTTKQSQSAPAKSKPPAKPPAKAPSPLPTNPFQK